MDCQRGAAIGEQQQITIRRLGDIANAPPRLYDAIIEHLVVLDGQYDQGLGRQTPSNALMHVSRGAAP